MPRRIGEPSSIFLFDPTLPPHWPANMPRNFLFPEIGRESCGYVLLSVPACYNLHVLNGWVIHSSIVFSVTV